MKRNLLGGKTWPLLALLAGAIAVGCWWRDDALSWYYLRQLTFAAHDNRDGWVQRVASLDEAAVPRVLERLSDPDAIICDNMKAVLTALVKKWGVDSERSQRLIGQACDDFENCSPAGREKTLLFLAECLRCEGARPLPPTLSNWIGELLVRAERVEDLRYASLLLAAELVDCVQPGQWVEACRGMAERGLADARPGPRVAALRLMMRGPMRKDRELLARAIPMLADKQAAVRRTALLALASENELVPEDTLLPLLHDDDIEIQDLCELSLRQRGLNDNDIELARLISSRDPATRMRVLHLFPRMPDLNLSEWLRQLSHDPVPAVRAAAVRAAGENRQVNLNGRLREMAASDPSEAVRLNAQYYLQLRTSMRAMNER